MNPRTSTYTAGDPLAEVLPVLLRGAGVAAVTVETITKPPSFRGGNVSTATQAITGDARSEHRARGFGFWEFALERALDADPEVRRALLTGALAHSTLRADTRSTLTPDRLAHELSSGVWEGLPARTMVNLCSTAVTEAGEQGHLVLLDFGVRAAHPSSVEAAVDVIHALDLTGALFTSGRSFHFVSADVVSEAEMSRTLARAQLLSPLIDARWVSHQLIDGESRLRISTDVERNPEPHRLVQLVDPAATCRS